MAKNPPPCDHANTGTRIEGRNEITYCKACGAVLGMNDVGYDPKSGNSKEK